MVAIPTSSEPIGTTIDGKAVYLNKSWYSQLQQLFGTAVKNVSGTTGTMPGNFTGSPAADARHDAAAVKAWLDVSFSDVSGTLTFAELGGAIAITDVLCGVIDVADNKDYVIMVSAPFAFLLLSVTTRSLSGACTLVTKKNTTAIAGLSNAVSTSTQTTTPSSATALGPGDDVRLTISGNSACEGLSFTVKILRYIP